MGYGLKILTFRAKYDLSQEEMAKILGVSIQTIHRYETGKAHPYAMSMIKYDNKMKVWEERKNGAF